MARRTPRASPLPRDFSWLWAGQAVSEWGTQLSTLALPTLAIFTLSASTVQVGLLATLENLATPVIGLAVGVFIDRVRRRPVLIVADLCRMVILAGVVALWASHLLHMGELYAAAALFGACSVFFTIAYNAYVPSLVGREQLVRANTRLELSSSAAQLMGPASAGLLIRVASSAGAIAVDAVTFGLSALSAFLIGKPESVPRADRPRGAARRDIAEGIRFVRAAPVLRSLTITSALGNLGFSMEIAILTVFAYRLLHLSPLKFGVILTIANTGFLASVALAGRTSSRFGAGRSLILANLIFAFGLLVTSLARLGFAAGLLLAGQFLISISLPWYNIISQSMQQSRTPDAMLGRVNATMRTIVWGTTPAGAFLGGVLGQIFGVAQTLAVAGVIAIGSTIALFGQIRTVREIAELPPNSQSEDTASRRT
jgi:MFS family permease